MTTIATTTLRQDIFNYLDSTEKIKNTVDKLLNLLKSIDLIDTFVTDKNSP